MAIHVFPPFHSVQACGVEVTTSPPPAYWVIQLSNTKNQVSFSDMSMHYYTRNLLDHLL